MFGFCGRRIFSVVQVDVVLRRGTPADFPAAAEVYLRTRHASVPAIPPSVHDDDDVRSWFPGFAAEMELWVGEVDGSIVALMTLGEDFVEQLYVLPEHQGRGIGEALLGVAKQQRPHRLQLWAFESNVRAWHFYERFGFVAVQRTEGDNEEGAPDVRYEWTPADRQ